MKVKKIACLLTALVISASAAMVPAVANADAGKEVTVSSTTSYVEKEGEATTETDVSSAMGLWEASDGKTGGITAESGRFIVGGQDVYKARLKHEGEAIDDCKLNFKAKFNTNSYVGFKLSDGTEKYFSNNRTIMGDNGATDWNVTIVVKKDGTSSITMAVGSTTKQGLSVGQEFTLNYTPTNDVKITDVIACGNGQSGSARYARIYVPFTITPLEKVTTNVTATEAASYTEEGENDKIGFYGSTNVNDETVNTINWYAKIDGSWKSGVTAEVPTITAENSEVTFGLIINGDNAASTVTSAAYRLD